MNVRVFGSETPRAYRSSRSTGSDAKFKLVLVGADAGGAFVGGELCFPNGWAIADRLGRLFAEIHERTPQPTMPSVHAGARLLRAMKPGKTLWRMSWNFKLTDQLDLSTKHKPQYKTDFAVRAPRLTAETAGRKVFIRTERQTFTRLSRSRSFSSASTPTTAA